MLLNYNGSRGAAGAAQLWHLSVPLVICDDDHYYPPGWLQGLLQAARQHPHAAVGYRGWRVNRDLSWGAVRGSCPAAAPPGGKRWGLVDGMLQPGLTAMPPNQAASLHAEPPFLPRCSRRGSVSRAGTSSGATGWGALTANEGYLVRPAFFLQPPQQQLQELGAGQRASSKGGHQGQHIQAAAGAAQGPQAQPADTDGHGAGSRAGNGSTVPLLSELQVPSTPEECRLVDDIWMSGQLAARGVPRLVVPSDCAALDVSVQHPLDQLLAERGLSRARANDVALAHFRGAWEPGLWYQPGGEGTPRQPGVGVRAGRALRVAQLWLQLQVQKLRGG